MRRCTVLRDERAVAGPRPAPAPPGGGMRVPVADIVLAAQSGAVRGALARVRHALARAGVTEEACGRCEIVLAETLNNIVEHAYCDTAAGDIRLLVELSPSHVLATLTDRGRALPGLDLPEGRRPDLGQPPDALPEGGFGWFMIRALTDDLRYTRRNGQNRLALRIPAAPDRPGRGANAANLP